MLAVSLASWVPGLGLVAVAAPLFDALGALFDPIRPFVRRPDWSLSWPDQWREAQGLGGSLGG